MPPAQRTPRAVRARPSSSASTGGTVAAGDGWWRLEPLGLQEDAAQLVLLARLQDREHLVSRLQLGRPDRDLRLAVARDRDQPRPFGELQLLDGLARRRGALVDLHLDDLQI